MKEMVAVVVGERITLHNNTEVEVVSKIWAMVTIIGDYLKDILNLAH